MAPPGLLDKNRVGERSPNPELRRILTFLRDSSCNPEQ
jgi:hypothetical protein